MEELSQPDMTIGQVNHIRARFVNQNEEPYQTGQISVQLVDDVQRMPVEGTSVAMSHDADGVYQAAMEIPGDVPPGKYRRHYTGTAADGVPLSLMTRRIHVDHGVVGPLEEGGA